MQRIRKICLRKLLLLVENRHKIVVAVRSLSKTLESEWHFQRIVVVLRNHSKTFAVVENLYRIVVVAIRNQPIQSFKKDIFINKKLLKESCSNKNSDHYVSNRKRKQKKTFSVSILKKSVKLRKLSKLRDSWDKCTILSSKSALYLQESTR